MVTVLPHGQPTASMTGRRPRSSASPELTVPTSRTTRPTTSRNEGGRRRPDVVLTSLPQADGKGKNRPAVVLRVMPEYGDLLVRATALTVEATATESLSARPPGSRRSRDRRAAD